MDVQRSALTPSGALRIFSHILAEAAYLCREVPIEVRKMNKFIYLMQWSGEFRATKDPKGQPWLSLLEDPVPDINAKCARKEGPVPHQLCNTQRERSNETHGCAT